MSAVGFSAVALWLAQMGALAPERAAAHAQIQGDRNADGRAEGAVEELLARCDRPLATIAVVEGQDDWWRGLGMDRPEPLVTEIARQSGCFTVVERTREATSDPVEQAIRDTGELQGAVRRPAADYYVVPDVVRPSSNQSGALGGMFGGVIGGLAGGLRSNKMEVNVTLTAIDTVTTEQASLAEGYARKSDVSLGKGTAASALLAQAPSGGKGYATPIGQVVTLAYIDAYNKLAREAQFSAKTPVVEAVTNRRAELQPSIRGQQVRLLEPGTLLKVLDRSRADLWRVIAPVQQSGWVRAAALVVINR